MVTKKDICNVLKTVVDKDVKILPNRISNKDEKSISVEDSSLVKKINFRGNNTTFNQISFRLTIRYSTNETETEVFCWTLYESLYDIKDVEINNKNSWLKTLKVTEPMATGNVKNNIYEQKIEFALLYSV